MAEDPVDDLLPDVRIDRRTLDELFSLAYEELRRVAAGVLRGDAAATIDPTALVHEAWAKLIAAPPAGALSPLHFRRIAARAMRQVLVDAARRRVAEKRGGGLRLETLDDAAGGGTRTEDVLALDRALAALARLDGRQAAIVECRFFGGLEVEETASALGISEATVRRDWRAARAWLRQRLAGDA